MIKQMLIITAKKEVSSTTWQNQSPLLEIRQRKGIKEPIKGQIAGTVPDSDKSAKEDDGVALERLQRHSGNRPCLYGPESNEAEAKAANQTSQSLAFTPRREEYKEEGKVTIREEVFASQHKHDQKAPNQQIHTIRLKIALKVPTSIKEAVQKLTCYSIVSWFDR